METLNMGDIAKLDKYSFQKVKAYIRSQMKKSKMCRAMVEKSFADLGENSKKNPAAYEKITDDIVYYRTISPADKLICLAILKEIKDENFKEDEPDETS